VGRSAEWLAGWLASEHPAGILDALGRHKTSPLAAESRQTDGLVHDWLRARLLAAAAAAAAVAAAAPATEAA